jgi:hypothetical protein
LLLLIVVVNLFELCPVENYASKVVLIVFRLSNNERKLDRGSHAQETSALSLFPHLNFRLGAIRIIFFFRLLAFLFTGYLSNC